MFELYDNLDLQEDFIVSEDVMPDMPDFEDNLTQDQARDAARVMTAIVSVMSLCLNLSLMSLVVTTEGSESSSIYDIYNTSRCSAACLWQKRGSI